MRCEQHSSAESELVGSSPRDGCDACFSPQPCTASGTPAALWATSSSTCETQQAEALLETPSSVQGIVYCWHSASMKRKAPWGASSGFTAAWKSRSGWLIVPSCRIESSGHLPAAENAASDAGLLVEGEAVKMD